MFIVNENVCWTSGKSSLARVWPQLATINLRHTLYFLKRYGKYILTHVNTTFVKIGQLDYEICEEIGINLSFLQTYWIFKAFRFP